MPLEFDQTLSLADNLVRFRTEAESIDPDCASILFDNLELLSRDGDAASIRQAVREFNEAVLTAIHSLPDEPAT